jgi:diacylglycerol O-acyltransferase / wax synthase
MPDHLTALDATFLELEEDDPSAHMHVGAVMVFEACPGGAPPTTEEVAELMGRRLASVPRFRQRLSSTRTGGLSWPAWEDGPGFDPRDHIRRAALPGPGGDEELAEWASEFWSHRLERDRPLWELVVVEGLAGGRWALASKMHHCMIDGVASVDVAHLLIDGPGGEGAAALLAGQTSDGADGEDHHGGLASLPGALLHGARAGVSAALHPRRLLDGIERARAMAEVLVRDELVAAPASSLNQPIGPRRRYAAVELPLSDIKAIKRELGGTVNDVVLALTAGALRALLRARGEDLPERGLRAMVPVNVRSDDEHAELGNRISSLFPHLPVAVEDPLERYLRVCSEAEGLKAGRSGDGAAALVGAVGTLPPALHAAFARSLFATRLFNVTVTNVPGPQVRLSAFGAPLDVVWPLVPIAAGHALGVAVVSYDGRIFFGLNADHETLPDLDVLVAGLRDALDELRGLVAVRS